MASIEVEIRMEPVKAEEEEIVKDRERLLNED